jgi:hypothetical protein
VDLLVRCKWLRASGGSQDRLCDAKKMTSRRESRDGVGAEDVKPRGGGASCSRRMAKINSAGCLRAPGGVVLGGRERLKVVFRDRFEWRSARLLSVLSVFRRCCGGGHQQFVTVEPVASRTTTPSRRGRRAGRRKCLAIKVSGCRVVVNCKETGAVVPANGRLNRR